MSTSDQQIASLWLRILEGYVLDDSEQKQLLDALDESPELLEEFVEDLRIHQCLSLIAEEEQAPHRFADQIREKLLMRNPQTATSANTATTRTMLEEAKSIFSERVRTKLLAASRKQPANPRIRKRLALAAGLVLLLTGLSALWRAAPEKPDGQPSAHQGAATEDDSKQLEPEEPTLAYGHVLETGENESATLRLPDGTECTTHESTSLTISAPHSLQLDRGLIEARVPKQPPDQPLILTTPNARAEVLGTELVLLALQGKTRLDVRQGSVRLQRRSDGQSVIVRAGEFCTVSASTKPLAARASSGRLMSTRFGGIIFQDYAQVYETGRPALDSLTIRKGPTIRTFSPRELYEHRVKTQHDSDTMILVKSPRGESQFSSFVKMNCIVPDAEFEFDLPLKDTTPDALRIQYPLHIDARYDERVPNSQRPRDLRFFMGNAPAPRAKPFSGLQSVRFPTMKMDVFIETNHGQWRMYVADLIKFGQLDDGRWLYEYRVSLQENKEPIQHGVIAVDDVAKIRFRVSGVHIRLGPVEISNIIPIRAN